MWPLLIVLADPQIEIGLQLVERTIHLFAERDTVELVEYRFVEVTRATQFESGTGVSESRYVIVVDTKPSDIVPY